MVLYYMGRRKMRVKCGVCGREFIADVDVYGREEGLHIKPCFIETGLPCGHMLRSSKVNGRWVEEWEEWGERHG